MGAETLYVPELEYFNRNARFQGDYNVVGALHKSLLLSGTLVLPWLLVGVAAMVCLNDGYLFPHDVLSELGASGSSTEGISPFVNNYPVGGLFIAFGIGVTFHVGHIKNGVLSGVLISVHGIGSIMAGFFRCDPGCPLLSGSIEQFMHTFSGLIMFVSLLSAAAIWFLIGKSSTSSQLFGKVSLSFVVLSSAFLLAAFVGHSVKWYAGLFESLSYGLLCAWCFLLAVRLYAERCRLELESTDIRV